MEDVIFNWKIVDVVIPIILGAIGSLLAMKIARHSRLVSRKRRLKKKEEELAQQKERQAEIEFLLSDKNMLTIAFIKLSIGVIAYLFAYSFCLATYFAFSLSDFLYAKILWIILSLLFLWVIISEIIHKRLASRSDLLHEVYEIHRKNIKADLDKEKSDSQ